MVTRAAAVGDKQTNGTTISTSNSGLAAGIPWDVVNIGASGTFTYDTAHTGYRGSAALKITTPGSAINVNGRWDNMYRPGSGVAQVATAWLYFTANPSVTTSVIHFTDAAVARICEMRITGTGKVRILNAAGTSILETTNSIALNQWVRADMLFTPAASTGVVQAKLYNNPNSSTPTETTSQLTGQNLRTPQVVTSFVGVTNGATNITYWVQAAFTDGAPLPFGGGWVQSRWVGAVTHNSVSVSAKVFLAGATNSCRLAVSTQTNLSSPTYSSLVSPDSDGTIRMSVTGLSADTQYYYGIEVDGAIDSDMNGEFDTAPTPGTQSSFTFCAASCGQNWSNNEVFDDIVAESPKFFIHLGDLHYRDISTNDQVAYHKAYDQVLSSPRQANLYAKVPVPYIWSDHDSVGGNGDGSAASVPAANAVYRSRVPYHSNLPGTTGCYFSFVWGRIKFICTDGRSFMDPIADTDDVNKTKLGSTQKAWLKTELSDTSYPVKVWLHDCAISNGTTFAGDDTWSAYSTERQELVDYIRTNNIRVAYVCGDLHMVAADDGTNVPTAGASPAGFPVFVAAPLDNTSFGGNGTYTSGEYPTSDGVAVNLYGRFTVTDSGSQISLAFQGKDSSGTVRISQTSNWTLGQTITLGVVTEADSPQTMSRAKTRLLGTNTEADAANSVARNKSRSLEVTSDTETALSVQRTKLRTMAVAVEGDSALSMTRTKTKLLGLTTSVQSALATGRAKSRTLAVVGETEASTSFARLKSKVLSVSLESDAVFTVSRPGTTIVVLGAVQESDAVSALGRSKTRLLAVASETSSAVALSKAKVRVVATVSETGLVYELPNSQLVLPGSAIGVDVPSPSMTSVFVGSNG